MLTNHELLPYSLDLANCGRLESAVIDGERTEYWAPYSDYMHRILGNLADYENETLCFTEEELLMCVNEIMVLEHEDAFEEVETANHAMMRFSMPCEMEFPRNAIIRMER